MFRTILLATGGSRDAEPALLAAADLAKRSRATLHLVMAYDLPPELLYMVPAGAVLGEMLDSSEAAARAALGAGRSEAASLGATVGGVYAERGEVGNVVRDVAESISADLIVIGGRELGALHRLFTGSVSEAVLHKAYCPVLIVHGPEPSWPPAQMVIGFDESPAAKRAARLASTIAHLYPEVTTTLIEVLPDSLLNPNPLLRNPYRVVAEHRRLDRVASDIDDVADRSPATSLAVGDAGDVLLARGDAVPLPNLIVIGSRRLGEVRRLIFGSVSTKIHHAGHSPLLIVPEAASH